MVAEDLCSSVSSKMLMKTGFVLLALTVLQVPATLIEPEFIEDVIKRESELGSSRIVSGWEAVLGQHPHQASLRMVSAVGGVSSCGGSFVHREWVITAAHCTALGVTIVVRGGLVNLTTPEYIFEASQWWNYPTYNDNDAGTVQPNDISILKLVRPVTFTRNLKPIRIQSSADAHRDYDGEVVHTSGYGRTWTGGSTTEVLRWVYLYAVSNPTCARNFGALITDNAICARWYNVTSQSPCQGDSGGPLVHVNSEGVEVLIGVTSFVAGGTWGCHSGFPAGFIRPGPFHSWFTEVSGIDFENLEDDEDDTTEPPSPPEEESEEEGGDSDEDSSSELSESEEDDDDELSQLMKRLQVKVKVKVSLNKYKKVKKGIEKQKVKKHH